MNAYVEKPTRFSKLPETGGLVFVRSRRWLVDEVATLAPSQTPLARLACTDDDAQGQNLEVLRDYEVDRKILEEEAWKDLASRGFDKPRFFASFLHTLRWNCVTNRLKFNSYFAYEPASQAVN